MARTIENHIETNMYLGVIFWILKSLSNENENDLPLLNEINLLLYKNNIYRLLSNSLFYHLILNLFDFLALALLAKNKITFNSNFLFVQYHLVPINGCLI